MFQVEIAGKKTKAKATFYTAQLYEAEFMRDIIQDFFGVVDGEVPVSVENGVIAKIDFTKINWLASARALWALVKTADESTPSYTAWMKKAEGVNLWELREQIASELSECFFRSEAAGEEDEQAE